MLISHKYKFLTIDIPKTGTRSLRQTLAPIGGFDFSARGNQNKFFKQHGNIASCESGFIKKGWNFDDYLKVSMVRNPWHRLISFFLYQKANKDRFINASSADLLGWSDLAIAQGQRFLKIWKQFNMDDEKVLRFVISKAPSQRSFFLNGNGDLTVDILGKTENLEKHFDNLCKTVGINPAPKLKHENKGLYPKHYTEYYTQELIDMVASKDIWVINKFNYDYKPTSDRNDVYYDKPLNQIVRNKKLKFNKNSAKDLLIDVNNILRTNGIDCFIVFGTLLGAYRDQDIIEHDKDVDMAIVGESEGECFKDIVLQGEFLKHGILLAKNPRKYTLIRGDHYIDIYHYVETSDGDFRSRITPHANYKLKKEDFPLQEIDFLDQKFLTVNNIERYLEERYGDNWRVPIKNTKAQF